ncbi:MAG: hypothetical protein ACPLZY_02875 [Candidatus Norongarragalinales archaeon]
MSDKQVNVLREKLIEFLKSEGLTDQFALDFQEALLKKLLIYFPEASFDILAAGYVGSLCTLELLFKKLGLIGDVDAKG